MLRAALKITELASSTVTSSVHTVIPCKKNQDPYDLSFLDSPNLSEPRKEALYRMTMEEVFTNPFPVCIDMEGYDTDAKPKQRESEDDLFNEMDDPEDLRMFLQAFKAHEKTAQITRLLEDHPDTLKRHFEALVPVYVSYVSFWQRFFYRCDEARIERLWEAKRRRYKDAQDKSLFVLGLPFTMIYKQSSRLDFLWSDFKEFAGDMKHDTSEIVTQVSDDSTALSSLKSDFHEFASDVKTDSSGMIFKVKREESDDVEKSPAPSAVQKEAIKLISMTEVYANPLISDASELEKEGVDINEEEQDEVRLFLDSFDLASKTEHILELLEKHPDTLKVHYYALVPLKVSYVHFWQRFFYRCDEERIEKRLARQEEVESQARARALGAVKSTIIAPIVVLTFPFKYAVSKLLGGLESNKTETTEELTILEDKETFLYIYRQNLASFKLQLATVASKLNENKAKIADTKYHVSDQTQQMIFEANEEELEAKKDTKGGLVQVGLVSSVVSTNEATVEELEGELDAQNVQPDLDSGIVSLKVVASPSSVVSLVQVDWRDMAKLPVGQSWSTAEE